MRLSLWSIAIINFLNVISHNFLPKTVIETQPCLCFMFENKSTNYLPQMNIASTNMSVTIVVFSPQFQLSSPQSISSHDWTSLHFVRFYKNPIFLLFENIKYAFIFFFRFSIINRVSSILPSIQLPRMNHSSQVLDIVLSFWWYGYFLVSRMYWKEDSLPGYPGHFVFER